MALNHWIWLALAAATLVAHADFAARVVASESTAAGRHKLVQANVAEDFFQSSVIPHLSITINEANLIELQKDNRNYVRAHVREAEAIYTEVAIHLKGGTGSFRELDDKPGLTLNFDKFKPGQKFHGLDK